VRPQVLLALPEAAAMSEADLAKQMRADAIVWSQRSREMMFAGAGTREEFYSRPAIVPRRENLSLRRQLPRKRAPDPRTEANASLVEPIRKLRVAGHTNGEIAARLGVTRSRVAGICKKHGI
jgi:hypothetical protein